MLCGVDWPYKPFSFSWIVQCGIYQCVVLLYLLSVNPFDMRGVSCWKYSLRFKVWYIRIVLIFGIWRARVLLPVQWPMSWPAKVHRFTQTTIQHIVVSHWIMTVYKIRRENLNRKQWFNKCPGTIYVCKQWDTTVSNYIKLLCPIKHDITSMKTRIKTN